MKRKDVLRFSDAINDVIDVLNDLCKCMSEKIEILKEVDSDLLNCLYIPEIFEDDQKKD